MWAERASVHRALPRRPDILAKIPDHARAEGFSSARFFQKYITGNGHARPTMSKDESRGKISADSNVKEFGGPAIASVQDRSPRWQWYSIDESEQ